MASSTPRRTFSFVQLDVFANRPLEGNPLAVFPDARGLNDSEMQAVAKEMNLSETTFVLPREGDAVDHTYRVRIFTVEEELPFAGHPTLGTAIHLRGNSAAEQITLDLNVGKIPVTFEERAEGLFGEMRQRDPEFGVIHSREDVARAAGLNVNEIAEELPVQTVSTGVPFTVVPLRSLAAAQRLRVDAARSAEYLERSGGKFFYFVAHETVNPEARLHARMIFYGGEDPATGSAAGCCAAWAVRYGVVPGGVRALIEQGVEMRRPSNIYVRADLAGETVSNVRVGGFAVEVVRGELCLV